MTDPGSKWACEYCTYENWPSAIKCTMCRAVRPGGAIITEDPFKSGWARKPWRDWGPSPPSRDTALLICPDQIADEAVAKWSCHICTYLNWPRAVRCTQCLCQRSCSPVEVIQTPGPVSQPPKSPSPPLTDFCAANNDRNRLPDRERHCTACGPGELGTLGPPKRECPLAASDERDQQQGCCSGEQRGSSSNPESQLPVTVDFQRIELAAASGSGGSEGGEENSRKEVKLIENRLRKTDLLFLNACVGVVEGDLTPVEAYKSAGGDISRQLTAEEAHLLNRPSAFDEGFTLVHLAIRFQRQNMLAVLLTENFYYITLLRDPVSRYLSEWKQVQHGATWKTSLHMCDKLPTFYQGDDWPGVALSEFMDCPSNLANNRQVRILADLSLVGCYNLFSMNKSYRSRTLLSSAKANLKNMAFYGLTEFQRKTRTFHLRYISAFTQFNSTRAASVNVAKDIHRRIEAIDSLDMQLYDFLQCVQFSSDVLFFKYILVA